MSVQVGASRYSSFVSWHSFIFLFGQQLLRNLGTFFLLFHNFFGGNGIFCVGTAATDMCVKGNRGEEDSIIIAFRGLIYPHALWYWRTLLCKALTYFPALPTTLAASWRMRCPSTAFMVNAEKYAAACACFIFSSRPTNVCGVEIKHWMAIKFFLLASSWKKYTQSVWVHCFVCLVRFRIKIKKKEGDNKTFKL